MGTTVWLARVAIVGARVATVAIVAATSLVPSIALNIASAQNSGGGVAFLVLAIASVVAAPFCLTALPRLLETKRYDLTVGAVVLFCGAMTFNLTNAVGLVGGERDSRREGREAKIATVTATDDRLSQVRSSLQHLRLLTKDATPAMVDAELAALRADPKYKRAGKCEDVTLADSSGLCKQIAATSGKREAATRIIELEAEERSLLAERKALGAAPSSPDAKVAEVTQLVGLLIPISKSGDVWVGVGLDVLAAILVEMLAALVSPIAILLFWPQRGVSEVAAGRKESEAAPAMPEAPTEVIKAAAKAKSTPRIRVPAAKKALAPATSALAPQRSSIEMFVERCIVKSDGATIQGAELYEAYCAFCETISVTPVSNKRLGLDLLQLGFKKETKRVVTYHDIALQEPSKRRLAVVGGAS